MTARRTRILLQAGACLCLISGAGAIAWSTVAATSAAPVVESGPRMRPPPPRNPVSPPLDAFAAVWDTPLRRPLVDPPPAPVEKPPRKKKDPDKVRDRPRSVTGLSLKLLGTVLEPGHSVAIFMDPNGRIELKSEGQELELTPGGARVESIQAGRATVSYQGREVTIALPASELP